MWIDFNKEKPKKNQGVLVTIKYLDEPTNEWRYCIGWGCEHNGDIGVWENNSAELYDEPLNTDKSIITAWMPLPEPYKEVME